MTRLNVWVKRHNDYKSRVIWLSNLQLFFRMWLNSAVWTYHSMVSFFLACCFIFFLLLSQCCSKNLNKNLTFKSKSLCCFLVFIITSVHSPHHLCHIQLPSELKPIGVQFSNDAFPWHILHQYFSRYNFKTIVYDFFLSFITRNTLGFNFLQMQVAINTHISAILLP